VFLALYSEPAGEMEREAAPGREKRMSQQGDGEMIGDRRAQKGIPGWRSGGMLSTCPDGERIDSYEGGRGRRSRGEGWTPDWEGRTIMD